MKKGAKLYIGFVTYGASTAKYLPYFLASLSNQYFSNFQLIVQDNSEEEQNSNERFISENYSDIIFEHSGGNIGYARAYNRMISRAIEDGARYFLAINPDVILDSDSVEKMVQALDDDGRLGSVGPKVRRWDFTKMPADFARSRTKIIDTVGIGMKPGLRFIDIGQGKVDDGRFDDQPIIGPSGAAAMYRLEALERVSLVGQYFDEMMFMYKEDCDLAYRLFLSGFESSLVSDSIVYHDRTAAAEGEGNISIALNRRKKSRSVNAWSFYNQLIIFAKFWHLQSRKNKIAIVVYLSKMVIYSLFFERYLLKEVLKFLKIKSKIKKFSI